MNSTHCKYVCFKCDRDMLSENCEETNEHHSHSTASSFLIPTCYIHADVEPI